MKKRNAVVLTIIIMILGFIMNFLFGIMPDDFKKSVIIFSESIGLSYTLFWIICTLIVVAVSVLFIWKKTLNKTDVSSQEKQSANIKTQTNIYGDKSTNIGINKGNINVK